MPEKDVTARELSSGGMYVLRVWGLGFRIQGSGVRVYIYHTVRSEQVLLPIPNILLYHVKRGRNGFGLRFQGLGCRFKLRRRWKKACFANPVEVENSL